MIVYCSSLPFFSLRFHISIDASAYRVAVLSIHLAGSLLWTVFLLLTIQTPSLSIAGKSNSSLHDLFVLIRKKERLLVLLSSSVEGCLTQYEEHLTFPITTCQ